MQRASIASYSDKWSLRAKWPRWSSRPTSPAVIMMQGDMRETLRVLADNSVDSVVTDPPYHLTSIVKRFGSATAAPAKVGATGAYERASRGFMGQQWDGGDVAFQPETWAEIWRVLKPGGHLVAFSGTRTYHRMVCAIEDAGFEIRDQLAWAFGSGFPKSHDVSKGIDKAAGAERQSLGPSPWNARKPNGSAGVHSVGLNATSGAPDITAPATPEAERWQGWGTALKPAWEPICLARKPLEGTVAANIAKWGTGALNIDGCRIAAGFHRTAEETAQPSPLGRWPANFCHDGSDEVLERFPNSAGQRGDLKGHTSIRPTKTCFGNMGPAVNHFARDDSGSAARFFYCAKASRSERGEGNNHPTVKPVALMEWLVRMVTPAGGLVLDPFMGSGSTAVAAQRESFRFVGCELSADYIAIAKGRLAA